MVGGVGGETLLLQDVGGDEVVRGVGVGERCWNGGVGVEMVWCVRQARGLRMPRALRVG